MRREIGIEPGSSIIGTPEAVIDGRLAELVAQRVLVSSLRPPMTVTDTLGYDHFGHRQSHALCLLSAGVSRKRIGSTILRAALVLVVETASPEDYGWYVHTKLEEELEEYLSSGDVAEVVDLVEVCFAAAALHGVGQDELLAIARDKRRQRAYSGPV